MRVGPRLAAPICTAARYQGSSPLRRAGAFGGLLFAGAARYARQGLCAPGPATLGTGSPGMCPVIGVSAPVFCLQGPPVSRLGLAGGCLFRRVLVLRAWMKFGTPGAVVPIFIVQDPADQNPSGSPLRGCFAPLYQDAPLLDLGPKGRGPLGLSLRAHRCRSLVAGLRPGLVERTASLQTGPCGSFSLQPSAFSLQPSAFSLQPSEIAVKLGAWKPCRFNVPVLSPLVVIIGLPMPGLGCGGIGDLRWLTLT